MEVDENINKEASPITDAGLDREIKKEPEEHNEDMPPEISKEHIEGNKQHKSRKEEKEKTQNENLLTEVKKEPVDPEENDQPEAKSKSEEQNQSILQVIKQEPIEPEQNNQPDVRDEPEKEPKKLQTKVSKKPEEVDSTGQNETRKELGEPEKSIQSEVRNEIELVELNLNMLTEVNKKPEEQSENILSELREELEKPIENKKTEIKKKSGKQDENMQAEIRNDSEKQEKNMETKVRKESTQVQSKQVEVRIEPEEQDENMETETRKESEEQDENMQIEIRKESEEQDKNIGTEPRKEQDENMQTETRKESEEPDENMQTVTRKDLEEQVENMQIDVRKESEEQDEEMEVEIIKESVKQSESMQAEVLEEQKNKEQPETIMAGKAGETEEPEIIEELKEQVEKKQQKVNDMEVDHCVKKTADCLESSGSAKPELVRLTAGASIKDDGEEMIQLTADEVKQYLLKKIGEYMNSSVNPLYTLHDKAKKVEEGGKHQAEEYSKLYKGLQLLQRKHENFLRNVQILPKIKMCHVNVSADYPMETVRNPETLLKKEGSQLSITKVENPANKPSAVPSSQPKTPTAPIPKSSNIECIDLTDETDPPPANTSKSVNYSLSGLKHPAPLPPRPFTTSIKKVPPKPRLKISAEDRGIVLQWDMPPNPKNNPTYDPIATFEIFGYQEQKNSIINTSLWKRIGSVKSMSLPMACTLTQFVDGNKYHFAIRAVDVNGLCGNYSDAISIIYKQRTPK